VTLPSFAELSKRAEHRFSIWGPNSGGGQTVILVEGRLYDVVYGDESRKPGGAEEVRASYAPAEYAALFGAHPMHARVVAHLRALGLLAGSTP
jgi:hypothetical protein